MLGGLWQIGFGAITMSDINPASSNSFMPPLSWPLAQTRIGICHETNSRYSFEIWKPQTPVPYQCAWHLKRLSVEQNRCLSLANECHKSRDAKSQRWDAVVHVFYRQKVSLAGFYQLLIVSQYYGTFFRDSWDVFSTENTLSLLLLI